MPPLDTEEKALLGSVELGEWQPVTDIEREIQRYQRYAQAHIKAIETISINMPMSDVQSLKTLSEQAGVPFDSLIASVLHQYVASQLGEV